MKHRRFMALAGAAALAVAAVRAAVDAGTERPGFTRRGRGRTQPHHLGRLRRARRDRSAFDWVTPFETKTGCKVNTIDMTDSNNGVTLMQSGDYDGGSFSGDATQRLMVGGIVAPTTRRSSRTTRTSSRGSRTRPTTRSTACRTASLTVAARTCSCTTPTSYDGADVVGRRLEQRRRRDREGQRLRLVDLHRRRGTAPEADAARPRHRQPVPAHPAAIRRRHRSWSSSATPAPSTGAVCRPGRLHGRRRYDGTSWQFRRTSFRRGSADRRGPARRRVDGMVGHLDDRQERRSIPTACTCGWTTWRPRRRTARPRSGSARPTSQQACDYAETIAAGHCELTHATDEAYYDKIWYWSTPQADCADDDDATTCKDQDDWVEAWTQLRGT